MSINVMIIVPLITIMTFYIDFYYFFITLCFFFVLGLLAKTLSTGTVQSARVPRSCSIRSAGKCAPIVRDFDKA